MSSSTAISQQMSSVIDKKLLSTAVSTSTSVNCENMSSYTSSQQTGDLYFQPANRPASFIAPKQTNFTFNVKTDSVASFVNGNATNVIKHIEVLIGGSVVETIQNVNGFSSLVTDNSSGERSKTLGSMLHASSETEVKEGADLTQTHRCVVALNSSILGLLAEDYYPIQNTQTRLRLVMETSADALLAPTGTPHYQITDMALQFNVISTTPEIYNRIVQEAGGVFKLHSTGVTCYTSSTMNLQNSQHSIAIPCINESIKSILTTYRLSSSINNYTRNTFDRINPGLIKYHYMIGGMSVPSLPILCGSQTEVFSGEAFSNLVRSFHSAHDVSFTPCYTKAQYDDLTGTTGKGSFVQGIDFTEANSDLMSNVSNGSTPIFLELQTRTGLPSTPITVESYVTYDLIVYISAVDGSVVVSR